MEQIHNSFAEPDIPILANKFKVLSEPSRLKILKSLIDGEKCVTDIIHSTDMLQANVSKQLKILQKAGIIDCNPKGLQRFYYIKDYKIIEICHLFCS